MRKISSFLIISLASFFATAQEVNEVRIENPKYVKEGASLLKYNPTELSNHKFEMIYEKLQTNSKSWLVSGSIKYVDDRGFYDNYYYNRPLYSGSYSSGFGIGLAKRKYLNNENPIKRKVRFLHFAQAGINYNFSNNKYTIKDQYLGDTLITSFHGYSYLQNLYSYKEFEVNSHRVSGNFLIGTMFVVSEVIMLEIAVGGTIIYSATDTSKPKYEYNYSDSPFFKGVIPKGIASINILLNKGKSK